MEENKMGTRPILPLIISMSLPAMFSMLVQALYNIVDSVFVSMYDPVNALAAVSLAFPVQTLMIAVAVGTGVGLNSLISRRMGEGRQAEADKAASHGIILAIFSWLLFVLFGIFCTRWFFELFSKNQLLIDLAVDYTSICTIFSLGIFMEINLEKTLQATGEMIHPMKMLLVGAITNIILDPIMIFGLLGCPEMGITGAAVATVLGQILSMVYALYVVFRKNHAVNVQLKGFRLNWSTVRDIYMVGIPSIIMQSISSVLTASLNMILIGFSEAAVSVLGVYYKLQSFVFMPVFGLTQGVMPIMGYSYGARNKKRLMDTLKYGCVIALGIMLAGTALFCFFPQQLLSIFNAGPELMEIGVPALRTISISFAAAALGILFSTLFQALGFGGQSLLVSALRQLVIILPVAWFLSRFGLNYVWWAFPISEVVALAAVLLLFGRLYRNNIRDLAPDQKID